VRVRDWAGADHYRVLGVAPTATRDEITAAYRARARVLHPDTGASDPAAEEQFVRVATAYRVLTGPQRDEYDRARRRGQVGRPVPSAAVGRRADATDHGARRAPTARPWHLTRRGARGALWGGVALMVAGVVAAVVVIALQVRDARLRSDGVPVEAVVTRQDGAPRLEFVTRSGDLVVADLPDTKSGGVAAGDVVDIRYDRDDPTRVVTQTRAVARDITLWIVAAKLVIVGAILTVLGARRLLRRDA
jgi:hypothetical protein